MNRQTIQALTSCLHWTSVSLQSKTTCSNKQSMFWFVSGKMDSLFLITWHTTRVELIKFSILEFSWWHVLLLCFLLSHLFIYFSELRAKHKKDLEDLTLTKQPLRTLHFFLLAMLQYLKRLATYILSKRGLFFLLIVLVVAPGVLVAVSDGLHRKVCCRSNAFFL